MLRRCASIFLSGVSRVSSFLRFLRISTTMIANAYGYPAIIGVLQEPERVRASNKMKEFLKPLLGRKAGDRRNQAYE
jgi:hypothetical protein